MDWVIRLWKGHGHNMGEIIFSVCIGGFLILSGIALNIFLSHEEKQFKSGDGIGDERN